MEHSAILPTFFKLPFVIKIFVLSVFEWPFYTGFTVNIYDKKKQIFPRPEINDKDTKYINIS